MMKKLFLLFCISGFVSCKAQKKENDVVLAPDTKQYTLETVVSGVDIPWGMAWLPDGSMLITERGGTLYHFKEGKLNPLKNTPAVVARGQGGLLDVAVHPNYAENGWIYLTFSSPVGDGGSHTELVRAQLKGQELVNIQSLYKATPNTSRSHHFGSRIVFDNDGYVYFTIGDRGDHDNNPQDLKRDGGKVYRLHDDGRIPQDNPFVGQAGVKEATYSYGHRNPQGMVVHPETGEVWIHEHGPRGGDEINIVKKAANYGWPVITYGINYNGTIITDETHREGMEQPLYYWIPSIAPSGMAFVTGDRYPEWKGHLLVGSLVFQYLELVKLQDKEVVAREKIADGIGRLRDVRMGPDGYIYLGVEGKGILKIVSKS